MYQLPKWAMTGALPSVGDFESATAIEMVAKVYNAMTGMIDEYNKFADQINEEIRSFTGSSSEEIRNFKQTIEQRLTCKFNDLDAEMRKIKVDLARDNKEWLEKNAPFALPVVTAAENGKMLVVMDGAWKPAAMVYDDANESLDIE